MDEEEYQEEQSDSKINLGRFFERMDSVEKVASNALSKANANFGIIENQKALINSLNVSIEAIETKVRDIANYIITEKKITKDEEADRLVEEQDKEQKNITAERLMALKGDQGVQGEPGAPAPTPEEGGGGGILGLLLKLGIGAFAIKTLWPILLPKIGLLVKGALGKGIAASLKGAGVLLKKLVSGTLGKIGLGIGKIFTSFSGKIATALTGVGLAAKGIIDNFKFGEKGEVTGKETIEGGGEGGEGGETTTVPHTIKGDQGQLDLIEGGSTYEENKVEDSNLNLEKNSAVNDMDDTLKDKDLVKTGENVKDKKKGKEMVRYKYKIYQIKIEKGGYLDSLSKDDLAHKYIELHKRWNDDPNSFTRKDKRLYKHRLPALMMAKYKLLYSDIESHMQGGESLDPYVNNLFNKKKELESVKENKDLDLSLGNVKGGEGGNEMTGVDDTSLLSQVLETPSTNNGQVVTAPSNTSNTTDTNVKITKIPVPFLNSISNQYLSITGEKIPPEFYRQYA